jgi:hypothetical protein
VERLFQQRVHFPHDFEGIGDEETVSLAARPTGAS